MYRIATYVRWSLSCIVIKASSPDLHTQTDSGVVFLSGNATVWLCIQWSELLLLLLFVVLVGILLFVFSVCPLCCLPLSWIASCSPRIIRFVYFLCYSSIKSSFSFLVFCLFCFPCRDRCENSQRNSRWPPSRTLHSILLWFSLVNKTININFKFNKKTIFRLTGICIKASSCVLIWICVFGSYIWFLAVHTGPHTHTHTKQRFVF